MTAPSVASRKRRRRYDTQATVQALQARTINSQFVRDVAQGLIQGKPDSLAVKRLLTEFVSRAPNVRKNLAPRVTPSAPSQSVTSDLVEFIASRIQVALDGVEDWLVDEPDLIGAFGLKNAKKRPASPTVSRRQLVVAIKVLRFKNKKMTLDVACAKVASMKGTNASESTVRKWYSAHKNEAQRVLNLRPLLGPL